MIVEGRSWWSWSRSLSAPGPRRGLISGRITPGRPAGRFGLQNGSARSAEKRVRLTEAEHIDPAVSVAGPRRGHARDGRDHPPAPVAVQHAGAEGETLRGLGADERSAAIDDAHGRALGVADHPRRSPRGASAIASRVVGFPASRGSGRTRHRKSRGRAGMKVSVVMVVSLSVGGASSALLTPYLYVPYIGRARPSVDFLPRLLFFRAHPWIRSVSARCAPRAILRVRRRRGSATVVRWTPRSSGAAP